MWNEILLCVELKFIRPTLLSYRQWNCMEFHAGISIIDLIMYLFVEKKLHSIWIVRVSMMHKIAIHSVPRSGSTWLGEILNSSANVKYCFQPLFSYKFKEFWMNVRPKMIYIIFFLSWMIRMTNLFVRNYSVKRAYSPSLTNLN